MWGSFEIRNQRLALTMLQQMVQCPIHENLENFNSWADEFERLPLYFLKFHGPQPIKEVMEVSTGVLFALQCAFEYSLIRDYLGNRTCHVCQRYSTLGYR